MSGIKYYPNPSDLPDLTSRGRQRKTSEHLAPQDLDAMAQALKDITSETEPIVKTTIVKPIMGFKGDKKIYRDCYTVNIQQIRMNPRKVKEVLPSTHQITI